MTLKTRLVTAAVMLAASTVLATAQERVVNVYNWSDYIDESILEEFTKETGIEVVYDVFDSNEVLETKLLAGSTGYDIVVPTGTFLARQITAGVFQKLDKSKLSNLENMDPAISARLEKYDPGNEHAINYMWGTTGLGINVDKVKERLGDVELNSWDIVFDPEKIAKLADCGVYMLDTADEIVPAALNFLGLDPDFNAPRTLPYGRRSCAGTVRPSRQAVNAIRRNTLQLRPGGHRQWRQSVSLPSAWSVISCRRVTARTEADQGVTNRICQSRRKARSCG